MQDPRGDVIAELVQDEFPVPEICITASIDDIEGPVMGLIVDDNGEPAGDALAILREQNGISAAYVSPNIPPENVRNLSMLTESISIDNLQQIEECLADGTIDSNELYDLLTNFMLDGEANRFFVIAHQTNSAKILKEKLKEKVLLAFLQSVKETVFDDPGATDFTRKEQTRASKAFTRNHEVLNTVLFSDEFMNDTLSYVSKHFQDTSAIEDFVFSDANAQDKEPIPSPLPKNAAAEIQTTTITGEELKTLDKDQLPDMNRVQSITFLASARPRGGKMTYGVRAKMGDKNWKKNVNINYTRAKAIIDEHMIPGNEILDIVVVVASE